MAYCYVRCNEFHNLCIQNASCRNVNLIIIITNSNSYHYLADFQETLIRVPNQISKEIEIFFIHGNKSQTGAAKTTMNYKPYVS